MRCIKKVLIWLDLICRSAGFVYVIVEKKQVDWVWMPPPWVKRGAGLFFKKSGQQCPGTSGQNPSCWLAEKSLVVSSWPITNRVSYSSGNGKMTVKRWRDAHTLNIDGIQHWNFFPYIVFGKRLTDVKLNSSINRQASGLALNWKQGNNCWSDTKPMAPWANSADEAFFAKEVKQLWQLHSLCPKENTRGTGLSSISASAGKKKKH